LKKIYNWLRELYIQVDLRFYNPYCKKCGACGEGGCCSPILCLRKQKFKCEYGDGYKKDLEFAYLMIDELYEVADKVKREEIHEKYYDQVYGKTNQ